MRLAIALCAALALGGCRQEPPPVDPRDEETGIDTERDNLLNLGYGAAVVSRTDELTLHESAIRAIDGDTDTAWSAPPGDQEQTLVFSLPAPARIEKLGIQTPGGRRTAASLSFAISSNGETFVPALSIAPKPTDEAQLFDVDIPRAQFIQVHAKGGGEPYASLVSVRVEGEWLAPPTIQPIAGCWIINGFPARFVESGGKIEGVIDEDEPLHFSGAVHGPKVLVAWAKGPQWGEGLITLSPSGERLSGMRWHEEPHWHSRGNAWFGERQSCQPAAVDADRVWQRFLAAGGWYPLFGLHFDEAESLVEERSTGALDIIATVAARLTSRPLRLVARDHHEENAAENRRRAILRLQSLRSALTRRGVDVETIEFVPVGSEPQRRPTPTAALRALYSVVEMQIAETDRSAF